MEVPPEFLGEGEDQGEVDDDEEYEEEEEGEDEDEDEDEEYEEEEEEENAGDGEGSGTTLRHGVIGVNQEFVNLETQASDAAADDVIEPGTSSIQKMNETGVNKTGGVTDDENKGELNLGEIDGLMCPICFEAWSSGGDHHVCCLPCGHIYGLSCIKKWLRRPGSSKCPQCKKKCGMKDIRLLYTSQIVAVDGELQRAVRTLEDKCAMLEKKNADWSKKEVEWKKTEAVMRKQVRNLEKMKHNLENLLEDMVNRPRVSGSSPTSSNCRRSSNLDCDAFPQFHTQGCLNKFILQKEFQVDGARLFDFDSCSQMFVVARRLAGMGGAHVLTKVSLLFDHERHDVSLPENIRVIKDLKVYPHAKIVLLASLGKKLSVLSTESNNTVLTYDLPAAGWSCSWDVGSSHYVYTGLQNGTVLQFDMRSTRGYVQSMTGMSCNPVHTLHSVSSDSSLHSGVRSVLSASSLGLCQWHFGGSEERPCLIPGSDKEGVCISLAHCQSRDDIVASYRPKLETPHETNITQQTLVPLGPVTQGSHIHYKKTGCSYQKLSARCANVSDIRLPKSAIIDGIYQNPVFVSADELTHELVLQELPSLMPVEHLKPKQPPTRDIKFVCHHNSGLLSCLSENSLRLFTAKLL